jgi:hypothetical protein
MSLLVRLPPRESVRKKLRLRGRPLISGIEPGISRQLHGAGVTTYAQLAALSVNEIGNRIGCPFLLVGDQPPP